MEQISTQAERVIQLFGGVKKLRDAMVLAGSRPLNRVTVYKWSYPRSKRGSGGLIPQKYWHHILSAADRYGLRGEVEAVLCRNPFSSQALAAHAPTSAEEQDVLS